MKTVSPVVLSLLIINSLAFITAEGRPTPALRLAVPYRQPVIELLPVFAGLSKEHFRGAQVILSLNYSGSSRAAIRAIRDGQADIALVTAPALLYFAAQSQPLYAFLQYFQTPSFTLLQRRNFPQTKLLLFAEDAMLAAMLTLGQRQSRPGQILWQNSGANWQFVDLGCGTAAASRMIDYKQLGSLISAARQSPGCSSIFPQASLLQSTNRLLVDRLGIAYFGLPSNWQMLQLEQSNGNSWPGLVLIVAAANYAKLKPVLQRFSGVLLGQLNDGLLDPEAIMLPGLSIWQAEFNQLQRQRLRQALQQLPNLIQGDYLSQLKNFPVLGRLYAWRYQALISAMESLQLIEPGLSSRDLIIPERVELQLY